MKRKIFLNINSQCNNLCINCILPKNFKDNPDLSLSNLEKLIEKIPRIGRNDIFEISGGEPTLHPQFYEICKMLREKYPFSKIALLSNSEIFSDTGNVERIKDYVDDVVATLYDCDEKTHDRITKVKGSFRKKVKGLQNLEGGEVKIHVKTLVIKPSYKRLPYFVDYCKEMFSQKAHININSLHIVNIALENKNDLVVRFSEAKTYIEEALDRGIKNNQVISFFTPLCLIDPFYWNHAPIGFQDLVRRSYSIGPSIRVGKATELLREFVQRPNCCYKCNVSSRCNWPWQEYAQFQGLNELKPIKT